MKKERINLFRVYKQDGVLNSEITREALDYELFGFLLCFLKEYEKVLKEGLKDTGKERDY